MSDTNVINRNNGDNRREQRYRVCEPKSVRVLVTRQIDDDTEQIEGSLQDLSPSGAKISVSSCLPMSEAIALTFNIADLDLEISVAGEVCWMRPAASDETWVVGCSFNPRLNEKLFCRLASSGLIERREHERLSAGVPLMAYRELDSEPYQIQLVDYTAGGFSINGPKPCQVGQRLRVIVPTAEGEGTTVAGMVQWDLFSAGQHVVGCSTSSSAVDTFGPCVAKYQEKLRIRRLAAIQARKEKLRAQKRAAREERKISRARRKSTSKQRNKSGKTDATRAEKKTNWTSIVKTSTTKSHGIVTSVAAVLVCALFLGVLVSDRAKHANQPNRVVRVEPIAQSAAIRLPVFEPTPPTVEAPTSSDPARFEIKANPPIEVTKRPIVQPSANKRIEPVTAPKAVDAAKKTVPPRPASDFKFRTRFVRSHSGDSKVKVTELVFPDEG